MVICSSQRRFSARGRGGALQARRIFTGSPVSRKRFQKAEREISVHGGGCGGSGAELRPDRRVNQVKEWNALLPSALKSAFFRAGNHPVPTAQLAGWLDSALSSSSSWLRGILSYSLLRPWAARLPFLVFTEEEQAGVLINSPTIGRKIATSSSATRDPCGKPSACGPGLFNFPTTDATRNAPVNRRNSRGAPFKCGAASSRE